MTKDFQGAVALNSEQTSSQEFAVQIAASARSSAQENQASSASEKRPAASGARAFIDNPWIMLAMLFLVTAALGLPFLWISRGFSNFWKIVLTVVVTIYTVVILWLFVLVMSWSLGRIGDAWQGM